MERIVIEVTEATAKKWRLASQQRREKIAQQIDLSLAKELSDSKEEFKQFLDEVGATMQARGLTEDALKDILKEDE